MAKLIDKEPTIEGEKKVWNSFSLNLPQQWIVYHNRSVNGREYDFCVMAPDIGLFIVEVKGWMSKNVVTVVDQNTIFIAGESKPLSSPRKQARGYRFDLLNKIRQELGMNPLVMSLVCYSDINQVDYYEKGLNIISEVNETIFAEDLDDPAKLYQKFMNRYNVDKGCQHDQLNQRNFALLRHYFEPNYDLKENNEVLNPGYSRLRIISTSLNQQMIKEILDEYFSGIKEIIFVSQKEDLISLVYNLEQRFLLKKIYPDKDNLIIGNKQIDLNSLNDSYRIFNLEIEVVPSNILGKDNLIIEEGKYTENQKELLNNVAKNSSFNFQQYEVEHSSSDKNILVTAGAGTGKTYSMVSRVAYLCNRTADSVVDLAGEIVMITFTNDAADNMRRRLKKMFMNYFMLTSNEKFMHLIENLNQMQISTIHKFAISLLQKDCLRFGLGYDSQITSENYNRKMLYHQYLNEYLNEKIEENPDFIYQLNMPVYELEKLLLSFSDQLYARSIDVKCLTSRNLGSALSVMPFFNDLIEKVVIQAEKAYADLLKENNLISLNESMIQIHDLVESGKLMKQINTYKYVFVDEFQDTDDAQIDMILGLQKAFGKQCRLFIVGDLKQSIYRFRGASLSAFEKIKMARGNGEWNEYSLNRNYRTDERLLNRYHKIFSEMGKKGVLPYQEEKDRLLSKVVKEYEDKDLIHIIECHSRNLEEYYQNLFSEIEIQINKIKDLNKIKKLSLDERTIAILVRYNWQISNIVKEASKLGITVKVAEGGDLYRMQSTHDLYKLVMAITHPHNKIYLMNFICSKYVNMHLNLAGLSGLNEDTKTEELINILDEYFMLCMGKSWNQIISDFETRPVLVVLRDIYEVTKPWCRCKEENKKTEYRQNYECLIENITSRYTREYLTINKVEEFLKINITTFQEQASRKEIKNISDTEVICTTIHKSKGLEYGTVVLPFTYEDISDIRVHGLNVNMIDGKVIYSFTDRQKELNASGGFDKDIECSEKTGEESRILYVAMTRAIRNLVWVKNLDSDNAQCWGSFMEVE